MEPVRWLTDEERRTWRAYLDSTRLLLQELDRQLVRDSSISFTDYELLVVLSEAPDRQLRMRELADAMTTTRSGVTRAINRLVTAGMVQRVECEGDKRGMLAELTDAGMAALSAAAPGHVAAVRTNMFDALEPTHVAVLGDAFLAMRRGMLRDS